MLSVLVTGILLLPGCRKSESSKPPNFFGSPPQVTEVSITKSSKQYSCVNSKVELCCVDPPVCTCCCIPDSVDSVTVDLDLVEAEATVNDADGAPDILVVLLRFLDPPKGSTGTSDEISLEMFDVGPTPVGQIQVPVGGPTYPVITGDAVQGDHKYTRKFYFTTNVQFGEECIAKTDLQQFGGDLSIYGTQSTFSATKTLSYDFHVEAVDRAGNITPSASTVLPIIQSSVAVVSGPIPCGPPTGNGGCQPGS